MVDFIDVNTAAMSQGRVSFIGYIGYFAFRHCASITPIRRIFTVGAQLYNLVTTLSDNYLVASEYMNNNLYVIIHRITSDVTLWRQYYRFLVKKAIDTNYDAVYDDPS